MPEGRGYMPEGRGYMPEERGYMPEERGYMEAMNSVATMFATQPVCNAARVTHALCSDQYITQLLVTSFNEST
jgi:hypothetical protein